MHPDACFHPEDRVQSLATCRALVEQVSFAMIFATTPDGPRVVHAPVVWSGETALQFHISRRNLVAPHLDGATALCVVSGPNAYISPRWYRDQTSVPTWNYVAAELEGCVRQLDIQDWRPTLKLSQNKPVAEREAVAAGLASAGASEMAQWMRSAAA